MGAHRRVRAVPHRPPPRISTRSGRPPARRTARRLPSAPRRSAPIRRSRRCPRRGTAISSRSGGPSSGPHPVDAQALRPVRAHQAVDLELGRPAVDLEREQCSSTRSRRRAASPTARSGRRPPRISAALSSTCPSQKCVRSSAECSGSGPAIQWVEIEQVHALVDQLTAAGALGLGAPLEVVAGPAAVAVARPQVHQLAVGARSGPRRRRARARGGSGG